MADNTSAIVIQIKSRTTNDIYKMQVSEKRGRLIISCSCPAGEKQTLCWHRLALINGHIDAIVSGHQYLDQVFRLVAGSHIPPIVAELAALEDEAEQMKRKISFLKRRIAAALG